MVRRRSRTRCKLTEDRGFDPRPGLFFFRFLFGSFFFQALLLPNQHYRSNHNNNIFIIIDTVAVK